MRAIAIVGHKKSGKTALALELARELKKLGLSVALAKHARHGFDVCSEADAARFREHADMVVGFSPEGSFVSWPGEREAADLLPLVNADFLILEGGRSLGLMPRILIAPDEASADELGVDLALAAYGDASIEGLLATRDVAGLARIATKAGFLLPGLDCGACGHENCRGLAAAIVAGEAAPEDCRAAAGKVHVSVGGRPLPLNPFMERILKSGIRGILSELKGYVPGPVDIHLE